MPNSIAGGQEGSHNHRHGTERPRQISAQVDRQLKFAPWVRLSFP